MAAPPSVGLIFPPTSTGAAGRGGIPSVGDGASVARRLLVHDEAQPLIQPERPGRIVGVDAEHRVGHAGLPDAAQRGGGERPAQAASPPRPADADVLEPAAPDAERLVLVGPDPVLDDARDL